MSKYVAKPIEIDAIQWAGDGKAAEAADWFADAVAKDMIIISGDILTIFTPEGVRRVEQGSYIVRGTEGEFYSVKPSVFELKYEPKQTGRERCH